MAITADDLLRNVRFEPRSSILGDLARLADPAGSLGEAHGMAGPDADELALARDMHAVTNDVRIAFDKLRAEVDERP